MFHKPLTSSTLHGVRQTLRDTFRHCARSAEDMADKVESGALPMDAPTALRLLATMFRAAADRD